MKVALISDIHGNLLALEKVLRHLDAEGTDEIICLGDVAATGPNPHEVLGLLRARKIPCVMGNTDEWLLNPVPRKPGGKELKIIEHVDLWCSKQLTRTDRAFL